MIDKVGFSTPTVPEKKRKTGEKLKERTENSPSAK